MYYITIDCGTTNSRVYVVDRDGKVYGMEAKMVGVRDTAVTGSQDVLRNGLRETIAKAIEKTGLPMSDISAVFSSGMITSEIGLCELPHLTAPCGVDDLAENLTEVKSADIISSHIPVYFVRGIKNSAGSGEKDAFDQVGKLDFMRGEETQVAGLLRRGDIPLPATVVVLSSHTKFIPIDKHGAILGSLTTMSGQIYDAIINHTFIGKSVEKRDKSEQIPVNYFDEKIVKEAIKWIGKVGLVRSLMFPRFLDVLLDSKWYERRLFLEALIAADDMLSLGQLGLFYEKTPEQFVLIGLPERCRLYRHMLRESLPGVRTTIISDKEQIDGLNINGILSIAKKAGIVK